MNGNAAKGWVWVNLSAQRRPENVEQGKPDICLQNKIFYYGNSEANMTSAQATISYFSILSSYLIQFQKNFKALVLSKA